MIRVTIELVPCGIESMARVIASARIINDGTGNNSVGNYTYTLKGVRRTLAEGTVKGFPRLVEDVWALLKLCIVDGRPGDAPSK